MLDRLGPNVWHSTPASAWRRWKSWRKPRGFGCSQLSSRSRSPLNRSINCASTLALRGREACCASPRTLVLCTRNIRFPNALPPPQRDGFTAVEYLFPYEYPPQQLAAWLQESGLVQVLFNAPPGDWAAGERGLAGVPGKETEFRAAMHKALEYAQTLSCPRVHVMAGVQPSTRSTFVSNLAWAAELAAPAGIELLIEPINTRDMPGYLLNRQDEAHAIVVEIGNPALKVQMDLYHCQIVEGDVSMKLRKYLGLKT